VSATPALFNISLPRWPKPNTSAIFGDESSQDEDYFVLGALYFWWGNEGVKDRIAELEAGLAKIKADHGISVIKWQDVPRPSLKLTGYKKCVEYLASQTKNPKGGHGKSIGGGVRFKCMVVDTKKYPLKKKSVGATDKLVGYMKFYTMHLADGIMMPGHGYFYSILIDDYEWRPASGHDAVMLGKCVEGRYLEEFQPNDRTINKYKFQHSELKTAKDEDSNLIQMADLLAGAVAFVRNDGMTRQSNVSAPRKDLVHLIQQSYRGVRLDRPMPFGPFGIWEFDIPGTGKSPTRRGYVPYLP
jgi:hypothetical protein